VGPGSGSEYSRKADPELLSIRARVGIPSAATIRRWASATHARRLAAGTDRKKIPPCQKKAQLVGANDCKCSRDQWLNVPSKAQISSR
jgi:hypothetical protein